MTNKRVSSKVWFWSRYFFALVILTAASGAYAQGFSASSGEKTVTLNDKVGQNQFIWISDAPLENIRGTSGSVTGTLTMDPSNLATFRGTISTQVATMKTGNDTRDRHLKSSEWLDAQHDPAISFAITSVSNITISGNTATGTAIGNFTLHGVTKQISIPFRMTYVPQNAKTLARAPGDLVMISSDFTISLQDYKIAGEEGTIGSKVGETIKVTAQLFGNALPK